jgi:hypothetical protein
MGRRTKANSNSNPAPASADDNATVEAVADTTVTAETPDNGDDAVLAALDAADSADQPADEQTPDGATDGTEETVEVMETEDVQVELEPEDEDAVLAELDAEEDDQPAPAAKKSGRKSTPKQPAAVVRQFCDVADHIDAADLKTRLDSINAKKVAEKAQNLVSCIETGKKLSGFTALAVRELTAKGRVSGKSLVEAFQADGKSLGTARAQAQQMTALFKTLGIATPDNDNPRELVSADNALVKELATLAA